ncbi:MAG: hypothetical protein QOI38_996 [Sphingomonadales bacterium]|jgi:hypothetical protein|nr:hypothetical protein [Sphingomonadales bacterium]
MYRLMLSAAALAAVPFAAFAAEPGGAMAEPVGGFSQDRIPDREVPAPRTEAPAPAAGERAAPSADSDITVTGEREAERRREEENRVVCRREVRTGSMMPQTTCRSAAEWARIRERSIQQLDRMRADRRSRDNTNANRDNQ